MDSESSIYPITAPNGKLLQFANGRCWIHTQDVMQKAIDDNRIWFGSDGNGVPRVKTYLYAKDRRTPHLKQLCFLQKMHQLMKGKK